MSRHRQATGPLHTEEGRKTERHGVRRCGLEVDAVVTHPPSSLLRTKPGWSGKRRAPRKVRGKLAVRNKRNSARFHSLIVLRAIFTHVGERARQKNSSNLVRYFYSSEEASQRLFKKSASKSSFASIPTKRRIQAGVDAVFRPDFDIDAGRSTSRRGGGNRMDRAETWEPES